MSSMRQGSGGRQPRPSRQRTGKGRYQPLQRTGKGRYQPSPRMPREVTAVRFRGGGNLLIVGSLASAVLAASALTAAATMATTTPTAKTAVPRSDVPDAAPVHAELEASWLDQLAATRDQVVNQVSTLAGQASDQISAAVSQASDWLSSPHVGPVQLGVGQSLTVSGTAGIPGLPGTAMNVQWASDPTGESNGYLTIAGGAGGGYSFSVGARATPSPGIGGIAMVSDGPIVQQLKLGFNPFDTENNGNPQLSYTFTYDLPPSPFTRYPFPPATQASTDGADAAPAAGPFWWSPDASAEFKSAGLSGGATLTIPLDTEKGGNPSLTAVDGVWAIGTPSALYGGYVTFKVPTWEDFTNFLYQGFTEGYPAVGLAEVGAFPIPPAPVAAPPSSPDMPLPPLTPGGQTGTDGTSSTASTPSFVSAVALPGDPGFTGENPVSAAFAGMQSSGPWVTPWGNAMSLATMPGGLGSTGTSTAPASPAPASAATAGSNAAWAPVAAQPLPWPAAQPDAQGGSSADQAPAQQAPAQQAPAQQAPGQQTPAQQTPAQQTPGQQDSSLTTGGSQLAAGGQQSDDGVQDDGNPQAAPIVMAGGTDSSDPGMPMTSTDPTDA
jgi:hypothetical protein